MKKFLSYAIPILLALFLIVSVYKSCNLYDEINVLKGRDIEQQRTIDEKTEELDILHENNEKLIARLDIARKEASDAASEYKAAADELKDGFKTVGELKANAENDKALITSLEIEISKRDEAISKLTLAYAQKTKEISIMTKQYSALAVELRKTRSLLNESTKLNILRADRIKALEKAVARKSISGTLKTGAIIGLSAAVIYGLVKK